MDMLNPVKSSDYKLGQKNIFCPNYNECLDYAAKRLWPAFDCSQCKYKEDIKPLNIMVSVNDDSPYRISPDIYRKLN